MQTQAIDFHPPSQAAPTFLLPAASHLFLNRAGRFAELAAGHSLGDWLNFLGQLSRAQHTALETLPAPALPAFEQLEQARRHGMPPLNAASLARPTAWREVLRQIARQLHDAAPPAAQAAFDALLAAPDEQLEKLADTLLGGEPDARQAALLPFIGAALQVVFTALSSQLAASQLQALDACGVCPCCGSLPVASIVRTGDTTNNLRYLHCSLCNTEWNVARATCSTCAADKDVALHQIEGEAVKTPGAVRAETCDSCRSYLKIVYQEKAPQADPVADDLATLALDMLVDAAGYSRSGPNLLLVSASA